MTNSPLINSPIPNFAPDLLQWFTKAQRAMPWRKKEASPYDVWVSEIMLQQTQVDTVIPYYQRFMARFPTVKSLAEAPQDDLLKMWEGLGYYSRARNLQKGAQMVLEKYGKTFPKTFDEWREIAGIGNYTAAAIASIAQKIPVPVVDGNVLRVWARLTCMPDNIKKENVKGKVFDALLPYIQNSGNPSWFNQAMMELGALICRPKSPNCEGCPLQKFCMSFSHNCVNEFPVTEKRAPIPHKIAVVRLIEVNGKFAMMMREERLWHGLYVFPMRVFDENKFEESMIVTANEDAPEIKVKTWKKRAIVRHQFSHFSLDLHPIVGKAKQCHFPLYTRDEIEALPLPIPIRKIWSQFCNESKR